MEDKKESGSNSQAPLDSDFVEMPRATAAPLVLATGIALLAAGFVFGWAMTIVGAALLFIGLGIWVASLSSSRGHFSEPLVDTARRARPVRGAPGKVERLETGMPGYRAQLPQKVHPISAGIKGGLVGGLVLPITALIYGQLSGHGIWYSVNLLSGMALPGIGHLSVAELERFHLSYLIVGLFIHATTSLVAGLVYGVLLPMLPAIAKPLAWGGLLMPMLWTAVTFVGLLRLNPNLYRQLDWPSFIFAQFIFGIAAALVVMRLRRPRPLTAGVLGGIFGGVLMIIPASLWAWLTGHRVWYPANVLAGMLVPRIGDLTPSDWQQFHADWFAYAILIHGTMSIAFGVVYSFLLPRLPAIPGPMSWGGLLMPVVWTGACYCLMGVVNPILHQRVDWPWFVVSQFIFGVVASIVVIRSEEIAVPPVGPGPDAT